MTYRRTDTDPETVERLTFVLFAEDGMAYGYADGRPELPCGQVREDEDWLLDATERIPLMTAGFFRQRVHPVAIDGTHLYMFAEGAPYRGRREHVPVELTKLPAEELAAHLDRLLANVVRDAADSFRTQTEDSYHADNLRLIERAYLRGNTAEAGSGSGGTPEQWRARRVTPPEPTARDLVNELGFPIAGASGQTVWIDP